MGWLKKQPSCTGCDSVTCTTVALQGLLETQPPEPGSTGRVESSARVQLCTRGI